jgi:hypothetical protein
MGIPELSQMDISEVSKNLFTQIQWDDILRSGVFLGSRDVSIAKMYAYFIKLEITITIIHINHLCQ